MALLVSFIAPNIVIAVLSTTSVRAADTELTNPSALTDPVRQSIDQSFRDQFYSTVPPIEWTGDQATCNAGTTSTQFLTASLNRLNYFRWLAGVPSDSILDQALIERAQATALALAVKGELSHSIPPDWPCASELAIRGAATSNIHLGYNGPDALTSFMEDQGSNNARVGHRRWILRPGTHRFGIGNVPRSGGKPAASTLVVFGSGESEGSRPTARDGFVAWPPSGYVPFQLVFDRWSFSLPNTGFESAEVSVKRNAKPLGVTIEHRSPRNEGYAEDSIVWTLSERTRRPEANFDDVYEVEIRNAGATYSYRVTAIDANRPPGTLSLRSWPIARGTPTGEQVGELSAKDPDLGEKLSFALVAGEGDSGNEYFRIDGNWLLTKKSFAVSETRSTIRVRTEDGRGGSTEEIFDLAIVEPPPQKAVPQAPPISTAKPAVKKPLARRQKK